MPERVKERRLVKSRLWIAVIEKIDESPTATVANEKAPRFVGELQVEVVSRLGAIEELPEFMLEGPLATFDPNVLIFLMVENDAPGTWFKPVPVKDLPFRVITPAVSDRHGAPARVSGGAECIESRSAAERSLARKGLIIPGGRFAKRTQMAVEPWEVALMGHVEIIRHKLALAPEDASVAYDDLLSACSQALISFEKRLEADDAEHLPPGVS
ncbi:MAG: hypothetical protein BGO92_10280 [Magnetospirillum sp. 64-120]|nr:MAG: hypothetical protein BGO92_10280 [Magnetospirillum sp. 64-120]